MKVCAAVMLPVSEYKPKQTVCKTQKTNMPIVDAMNKGRLPILSQSRPAMTAMMKL